MKCLEILNECESWKKLAKKRIENERFRDEENCPYCVGGYEQSVPYGEREQLEMSATTKRNTHAFIICETVGSNCYFFPSKSDFNNSFKIFDIIILIHLQLMLFNN